MLNNEYEVEVESVSNNGLNLRLSGKFDPSHVITLGANKKATGRLILDDKRHISAQQRKLIYALINDLCDYTGDPPVYWKERFKFEVQGAFGIVPFSLSDCSITVANYMILTILNFLFEEDIPFKRKWWYELPDDFPRQMLCLKNKTCVICGKPNADIAHYNAVGSGRNRDKISHIGLYIMTLCRGHHQQQHKIGLKTFLSKYHIKPIKVTEEIARKLKLGVIPNE
ncbi:putative HNHc nuclease [Ligilactobacillus equi]